MPLLKCSQTYESISDQLITVAASAEAERVGTSAFYVAVTLSNWLQQCCLHKEEGM